MKKIILILLLIYSQYAIAQSSFRGFVFDEKQMPIVGANIYLKGTYDGISSDANGKYQLLSEEQGAQILVVQALGYESKELAVLCSGEVSQLDIILKEHINLLTAVTITAGSLEASDEKKAVVLKPMDIVTTSGAIGDITGALLTLPGTSTVGNDGRLFVRGGDASETGLYMDGMLIGNAFGTTAMNVPTRTRFSPYLFKGTFFSTGGYSAEFGQALSSVLSLSSLDMPIRNQTDVSLMSLGGGVSQTWVGTTNAVMGSVNYYNMQPYYQFIKQNFDWDKSPSSWDTELSFRQKWGKNGMIKAYARAEGSKMTIWQKIPGFNTRGQRISIDNNYKYGNISFQKSLKNDWNLTGGIAYSHNEDGIFIDSNRVERVNQVFHLKWTGEKTFNSRFTFKNGLEWYVKKYTEALPNYHLNRGYVDHQFNYFTESSYYFNNQLVAKLGLRSGYSTLAKQFWVDPRFSIGYQLQGKSQLSFAAGGFHQLPEERLRILNQNLKNTESKHYILNFFRTNQKRTFRAEAFYKLYKNLATYQGTLDQPSEIALNGSGYAKGIDFFYRDKTTIRRTDFWVTYSLVDSKRKYAFYETKVQPSFAPKHNGSVVVKYFVTKLKSQIGSSWSWNSGYTFNNPNEVGEMLGKTKMYSNLSVSWSYLPRPNIIIHGACSNILGRDNVFGYTYASEADSQGFYNSIPINQGAKRMLFVGLFITISKDKTANNLNNL